MSATNAPMAARRAAEPYGAAKPARTPGLSAGSAMASAPRKKVGVVTHAVRSTPGVRASRISDGAAAPAGWWTAVLASTIPATCSRCASAQPSETGPPQSCATVTTGPVSASASVSRPRSSMRRASPRTVPVRSEKPMSSWSTATTRQPAGGAASSRRHR